MVSFTGFLFIYFLGGVTFLPLLALAVLIYAKGGVAPIFQIKQAEPFEVSKDPEKVVVKKGWIRVINQYQPKMPEFSSSNGGIISGIQSLVGSNDSNGQVLFKKGVVYGVLKHGTLFCFESEKQKEVTMILPMQDYTVSLFAPSIENKLDGELYNKTTVIQLKPAELKDDYSETMASFDAFCTLSDENITCNPDRVLYLTCARNTDKEDWYFGLIEAHHMLHDTQKDGPHYEMVDSTHFDLNALQKLITQVQSTPNQRETAWLNAIMGRIFLSMYKTERLKELFERKIRNKIEKTKRPTFLDEIKVRNVEVGDSIPLITEPKLLSLSAEGEVIVESRVEYCGGLTVEIETDFNWSYSSRMKPIRMHLVLAVQLKKLAGRMMFKLKAPPTNRYWTAFFEMPEMEVKIKPVVADKQIKFNIVTNAIESRLREVIAETMVLPNMTDTTFFPTGKGGIFGKYKKMLVKPIQTQSELIYDGRETARQNSRMTSSSKAESIKENPSVPDSSDKICAADTLKLKNRRAESVSATSSKSGPLNDLLDPTDNVELPRAKTLETPDAEIKDNVSVSSGTRSFDDTASKQSKGSRHRSDVLVEEEEIDDDKGSSIFSKISNLLPSESSNVSDTTSIQSSSSTGSKRELIMHMAENLLSKKSDEKKERKILTVRKNISPSPPPLPTVRSTTPESKPLPPEKPRRSRAATMDNDGRPPLPPRKASLSTLQMARGVVNEPRPETTGDSDHGLKVKESDITSADHKITVTTITAGRFEAKDAAQVPPPLPSAPRPKNLHKVEDRETQAAIPPQSNDLLPPSVPPRP